MEGGHQRRRIEPRLSPAPIKSFTSARNSLRSQTGTNKGKNIGKHHSEAMKAKTRATRDKYISCQQQAEEIWREQPDLSGRETARKLAKEPGDTWETIRKKISKKQWRARP